MKQTHQSPIQSSFLALSPLVSIKEAIESMVKALTSCVLITEDQQLLGIFTERDVVKITTNRTLIDNLTLAEVMTTKVITIKLSEVEDIFLLSQLLRKHKIRHLPVVNDQNQVVGVITPQSIRNVLKPEHLLRYIKVKEVIKEKIVQGSSDETIFLLAQKMMIYRVSCVIIVDSLNCFPIGIVTERDLVQFHNLGLDFSQVSAQTVMSTPLLTVQPEQSLWVVHEKMQKLRVRRLVVTQPTGELAGIVTQTQMLKTLDPTEMYQVMQQMQEMIDRQTRQLHQLNQQLQTKNTKLLHLSTVDELTQIVNRRKLNEFLNYQWQHLENLRQPLSVIICDVDNFKSYNDTYGHLAGDECLVKIAQTLRGVTRRASDLVARYGGEEFVVVLPNTDSLGAKRVAKTILTQIETQQIPHPLSSTGVVTVSLGGVTVNFPQTSSIEMLLNRADQLLYQSKQSGRNTYTLGVLSNNCSS